MLSNEKMWVLEAKNISVSYQQKQKVLEDFSCRFPYCQLIGIVGANGSGKSTLLKALMQIVPIEQGEVRFFGGERLENARHRIAYLPQKSSVDWDFPASVLDVVLMGLYKETGWFGRIQKKHKEKALFFLEKVKMADFANKHISELSGGQQQRVFLARAFAQEPDLYLLDEPLVGVDVATESIIIDLLQELRQQGKTIVMVHHQIDTFSEYFDYLLMLKEGKCVAFGETREVFTPENVQQVYGIHTQMFL
jgi:manganese/zinc/iron transport system ATP- binding protein